MPCLAMSNIALWRDGEEPGTRRRKMKKGKGEQSDSVLSWTVEIIKTLLCFIKHFKNKITPVREKPPQSTPMYLSEAKQHIHLEGIQCSLQVDGVCWTPTGRCLSDVHADICLPLPPFQRPKRRFCSCSRMTQYYVQTVPSPIDGWAYSLAMQQKPLDLYFRTSLLSRAPTKPAHSASAQGRQGVVIGKADVCPLLTKQGNIFTLGSSNEQQT